MVPAELRELETEIVRVADELHGVVEDLREIARGIHPAILSEGGLGRALRTLARRAAIVVELDVAAITRSPEPIQVAAYYAVSEALTNATRHAHASVVRVEVEERDDCLHLSVRDNGVGGADPACGSGLIGLRDRAEALGGMLGVSSPPGEGTLIICPAPAAVPLSSLIPAGRRETFSEQPEFAALCSRHAGGRPRPVQRASRNRRTASTRRCSVSLSGRLSLVRMLRTCFSTVPSVTKIRRSDARVGGAFGHQREHLPLPRRQHVERISAAAGLLPALARGRGPLPRRPR